MVKKDTSSGVETKDAPKVPKPVVPVEVRSSWKSKINWTAGIGIVATLLSYFGLDLKPEDQLKIIAAIPIIQGVVTWVLRTFFTRSITPSSV